VEVIRPDDLVNLAISCVNLRLDTSDADKSALVADDSASPAFLIVRFPPQSIAESAWFESAKITQPDRGRRSPPFPDDAPDPPDPPVPDPPGIVGGRDANAAIAHASRLVFQVPAEARIPFDSNGILDWSNLRPSLNAIAAIPPQPTDEQIAAAPGIEPPADTETALELPYRLLISPDGDAGWKNRLSAFASRGRTELWHTRLVLAQGDYAGELSSNHTAPLRAIWSPDYELLSVDGPAPNLGDITAMSADDRHQIVVLTSAFHGYDVDVTIAIPFSIDGTATIELPFTEAFVPQPFWAESVMLTALGGWLRSRGEWTPPYKAPRLRRIPDLHRVLSAIDASPDVEFHRAEAAVAPIARASDPPETLDLSEWVHVATEGRDHYVRIVYEGRLLPFGHRASLVKVSERKFEDVGDIVGAYLMQHMYIVVRERERQFADDDRGMPFKRVQVTTHVTPDIHEPEYVPSGSRSFWVEVDVAGASTPLPFLFHAVGWDVGDGSVDFTIPMMFVSDAETQLDAVYAAYNAETKLPSASDRAAQVPGQKILFAEAAGNDNTQLVTDSLTFDVDKPDGQPSLSQAAVHIPQVQELLGADAATTIEPYGPYVTSGFDAGAGVFAATVHDLGVEFQAQKAGGFATPDLGVELLTRARGPVAGPVTDAVNDKFDPVSFFGTGVAQLFGTFDLSELLLKGALASSAPIMATTTKDDGAGEALVETTIDWTPGLKASSAGVAQFEPEDGSTLTVHGLIQKHVPASGAAPGAPTFSFTGTLTNFDVTILDVEVKFVSFTFAAANGGKPNINVSLQSPPMKFTGDLTFVGDLTDSIPPGLFGDGPSIDLIDEPLGVRAGFAVALPPIEVGVFALKDVALGAALTLPFLDGKPLFDFNVSRRDDPFLLAVAIFGGGGFFHLQLDTAGMKELEAALEFGATASIDIGVASGGVHMMAGIYFSLQRQNAGDLKSTLSGYLRMGGSLSVLGLITVSVEFNLTFTYDSGKDKAYGRATLTVEVDVAFFSKSVELTVERGFGGSGDPKFVDLFTTPATWSEYALAYA
jgi:hypothetical protein